MAGHHASMVAVRLGCVSRGGLLVETVQAGPYDVAFGVRTGQRKDAAKLLLDDVSLQNLHPGVAGVQNSRHGELNHAVSGWPFDAVGEGQVGAGVAGSRCRGESDTECGQGVWLCPRLITILERRSAARNGF